MQKIKNHSLYLVLSEEYGKERPAIELARLAISGGIDMLQMREKNKCRNELVSLGIELCKMCKESRVKFIINDDPLLVKETIADGVHLGQEDLLAWPVKKVRMLLGANAIIGVATHSLEQFKKASGEDIDYIAFGPIFPTKTKNYCIGTSEINNILNMTRKPIVFIGGININNVDMLLDMGAKHIALIRALLEEDDIIAMARRFKGKINLKRKGVYETQDKW